ncbi:leucine-rich repeat extensin-like protein 6 [Salvia miltiorrhiza]|uniref:leucine-rich repeat extensin-like protein 6 n=1 Tax=Salvia miltiorrhiza TaxID=226208 RepID=UPI0025AD427F|nr:leucine-rich repeat extensin-like protein 6 [Salvia miltiorrhiza]
MDGSCMMSRLLLLCFLLCVSPNYGFGRKLVDMSVSENHAIATATELQGKSRAMFELDYEGTGPNVNGRSVPLPTLPQPFRLPPPSPPPPPPPPPPY